MRFVILSFVLISSFGAKAQIDKVNDLPIASFTTITPNVQSGKLNFIWHVSTEDYNSTWEIQGVKTSGDYKTVGIVWGTKENASLCEFSENAKKVSERFDTYRLIKYAAVATTK